MIIENERMVTAAVQAAAARTEDVRLKEVVGLFVEHAHAFLRAARLGDEEFEAGPRLVAALGHHTHATNNEVVLAADVLGLSTLAKLHNHPLGTVETAAALLGPFYRANAPWCAAGDSIARSTTPGPALFVAGRVRDVDGTP